MNVETDADWVTPEWSGGGFGEQLAAGSDLDGDGFPDLAVGDVSAQMAYVIFGGG